MEQIKDAKYCHHVQDYRCATVEFGVVHFPMAIISPKNKIPFCCSLPHMEMSAQRHNRSVLRMEASLFSMCLIDINFCSAAQPLPVHHTHTNQFTRSFSRQSRDLG